MEERRTQKRRQGPIRLAERRKELDLNKARTTRGPERRKAHRRTGIDRRRHTTDGNPSATGSA